MKKLLKVIWESRLFSWTWVEILDYLSYKNPILNDKNLDELTQLEVKQIMDKFLKFAESNGANIQVYIREDFEDFLSKFREE